MGCNSNIKCQHFGKCGGCSFQDIPYEEQLNNKQALVEELFLPFTAKENIHSIVASPDMWFYRNKMEYSFSRDRETKQIVCGLHRKDVRRTIVDMQECPIFCEDTAKLTKVITDYANKYDLTFYSTFGHKGFLRYFVVRKSNANKSLMINIVVTSQDELKTEEIIDAYNALELEYDLKSIYLTISDAKSDAVVPEKVQLLWGDEHIVEKVYGLEFKITPFTFFQVNPPALEKFYPALRELADVKETDTVLDVYCGVGTIASVLAPKCKFVWGVEYSEDSVRDAADNAVVNGIDNMSFMAGDARKVLYENMSLFKDKIDLLVVNPPRSGITPKTVKRLMEINAPRIVYSSCNAKTCAENLAQFEEKYELVYAKPFDFFPHTKHFEVLTLLKRK